MGTVYPRSGSVTFLKTVRGVKMKPRHCVVNKLFLVFFLIAIKYTIGIKLNIFSNFDTNFLSHTKSRKLRLFFRTEEYNNLGIPCSYSYKNTQMIHLCNVTFVQKLLSFTWTVSSCSRRLSPTAVYSQQTVSSNGFGRTNLQMIKSCKMLAFSFAFAYFGSL